MFMEVEIALCQNDKLVQMIGRETNVWHVILFIHFETVKVVFLNREQCLLSFLLFVWTLL